MAQILVVDDEARMADLIRRELEDHGHSVAVSGDGPSALDKLGESRFDLVVTDLKMPGMDGLELLQVIRSRYPETEVVLMTAYASAQTAVKAMKEGAYDYLTKPFEMDELLIMVNRVSEMKRLELENTHLREKISDEKVSLLGESAAISEIMELIEKVAGQDTTVLIEGESGTGKELAAHAVHTASSRSGFPLVIVNCAAIPESLIESELFGHEKGAFTGADRRRPGRFELADGGTIFLDEVAELSGQAQVKLLRVLQERTLERLGGGETISVDVRIIAATNRNLEKLVVGGEFREDLFYRLNVFPIRMPPLRVRRDDIILLARHFVERERKGNTITAEAEDLLKNHNWPGNVRELENVIERASILAGPREEITARLLSSLSQTTALAGGEAVAEDIRTISEDRVVIPDEGVNMEELERSYILRAVEKAGGNKTEAARLLHMTRRRLYSRMTHHNIDY